jgi:hypothetical protein
MFKYFLSILIIIFLFQGIAFADYYKWEDEQGNVQITDYPPPDSSVKNVKVHKQESESRSESRNRNSFSDSDAEEKTSKSKPLTDAGATNQKVDCREELQGISSLPPFEKERQIQREENERQEMFNMVTRCLSKKNYTELDNYARKLRTSKTRDFYGTWQLVKFYDAVSTPLSYGNSNGRGGATDDQWQSHLGKLEQWIKNDPGSITARIAYANTLEDYAWEARGSGYASEVTDQEQRSCDERLEKAEKVFNDARKLPENCPYLYTVMFFYAKAQGWDIERYNKIFNEAVRQEPDYEPNYLAKAAYLMPRWNGNEGDMEQFAEDLLKRIGGKEGYRIYYLIAREQASYYQGNVTDNTSLSWEKIKKGYEAEVELFGDNVPRLNYFCKMAVNANDDKTARKLMKKIGTNVVVTIWGGMENYNKKKEWAFKSCKSL